MRFDYDLVRKILAYLETREFGNFPITPTIEGYDPSTVAGHIRLMAQGGLIHAVPMILMPIEILSAGQEFLDAARDDALWADYRRRAKVTGLELPYEGVVRYLNTRKAERESAVFLPL